MHPPVEKGETVLRREFRGRAIIIDIKDQWVYVNEACMTCVAISL
jgi:hypothetical protein